MLPDDSVETKLHPRQLLSLDRCATCITRNFWWTSYWARNNTLVEPTTSFVTLHGMKLLTMCAFLAIPSFLGAPFNLLASPPGDQSVLPDAALAKLIAGNKRFTENKVSGSKPTAKQRAATAQGQHPFAVIVGCADSRTSPEIIFDQGIGDLFVVRSAGNLVDDHALGSIEYAVEHLGSRLIVILGHERCGAVDAALKSATAPGHVNSIVRDIQPAIEAAKGQPGDTLANAVHENAIEVAAQIRKDAQLGELASQVKVISGYYHLDTGKVDWDKMPQ
jgi:carbonic anhydrase